MLMGASSSSETHGLERSLRHCELKDLCPGFVSVYVRGKIISGPACHPEPGSSGPHPPWEELPVSTPTVEGCGENEGRHRHCPGIWHLGFANDGRRLSGST